MKATLTSKGQITIPTAIRRRLGLQAGQILEFDEEAPYILAVPVFDEEAMRAVVGCARGRLRKSTDQWLDETRGRVAERDR
jgi:AbrB family looped-hinge helix DNA binding protein